MKRTIIFLLLASLQLSTSVFSQDRVSLSVKSAELKTALLEIEKSSNFRFLYNDDVIKATEKVNIDASNIVVTEVLDKIFKGTDLNYRVLNNNLVVITKLNQVINDISVFGKVTSSNGDPIPGATIRVKGSAAGTSTNSKGEYSISVPDGSVLIFSSVGYEDLEITIAGLSKIDVTLKILAKSLDQVIVVGYGSSRKRDLTGSSISIKGTEISNLPALSATQAIQGKAAGVQIINSGAPGSAPNVRIRGTGSILGGVDPLYVVDGIITKDIRNINNADILSVDILKDASSTAIYGARASNGVILITTKAGSKSKFTINYNVFAGVKLLNHLVEMAGPNLYAVYSNEAANAPAILKTDITGASDWYKEITRPAIFQQHNLSLSGGKKKYRFYISAGYLNENGVLLDNNYNRITARINHDYAINSKFRIGNNLSFSHYKAENKPYSLFTQAYNAAPIYNAKNTNGTYGNTTKNDVGNPLATLKTTNNRSFGNRATGTLWGEYQLIKGLSFRTSFGIDLEQNNGWDYTPVYQTYLPNGGTANQKNEKSDLTFTSDSIYQWTWDNYFTFERKFGIDHSLKLTAGHTAERRNGWNERASIADGNVPYDENAWHLNFTDTAGGQQNFRTPIFDYFRRESYFIRANYSFREKFLVNATYRRDGSSNFSPSNKWGNFPAIGLGWIITKEKFMNKQKVFDFLKLRASYGLVGNDVIPANQFALSPTENFFSYFGTNRYNGATVTSIKDPDLKWETAKEFDIGLEFATFNNKLTGEIDYYYKDVTNALYRIQLPSLGFGSDFITNAAEILNQGVELSLGWNNDINTHTRYSIKGNITFNKNSVKDVGIGQALISGDLGNGNTSTRTTLGQEIGAFYVYKTNGIFQTNAEVAAVPHLVNAQEGDFRIVDMNNDGVINENDKYFAGSYQPKFYYGLNATFNWRQWDFGLDIFGNAGNKVYNAKKGLRFGGNYNIEFDVATNRWTPGSGINNYPRAFNGTATVSDYFVESGSFVRINNISAGYTFKNTNHHSPFRNLRIYLNAQNPLIYTKYTGFTPELPGSQLASGIELNAYPVSASYMLGLNVQF